MKKLAFFLSAIAGCALVILSFFLNESDSWILTIIGILIAYVIPCLAYEDTFETNLERDQKTTLFMLFFIVTAVVFTLFGEFAASASSFNYEVHKLSESLTIESDEEPPPSSFFSN